MAEAESEINFPFWNWFLFVYNKLLRFFQLDRSRFLFPHFFPLRTRRVPCTRNRWHDKSSINCQNISGTSAEIIFVLLLFRKWDVNLFCALTMSQQREKLHIQGEPKQYFYDRLILIEKDSMTLIMTPILQAVLCTHADLSNLQRFRTM